MGKFAATSTTRFIALSGAPFMVRRLVWGEGDETRAEYAVYEPAQMMGNHSELMHSDDSRLWGRVSSYFVREDWAHLSAFSRERSANVTSYLNGRKAVEGEIAKLAFNVPSNTVHII